MNKGQAALVAHVDKNYARIINRVLSLVEMRFRTEDEKGGQEWKEFRGLFLDLINSFILGWLDKPYPILPVFGFLE